MVLFNWSRKWKDAEAKFLSGQTALQGLLSGGFLNSLSFIFRYARQAVIAAFFGLSAQLDAFYMGMAILETVVFSFGFVFDVLGVPHLVKARIQGNHRRFAELTSTLFLLALLSGIVMGVVIGGGAGALSWLAPGFGEERRHILRNGLYLLLPIAILFLPYRALGAFFRSVRSFLVFYSTECILYAVSLAALFLKPHDARIIFVSSSLGYIIAFGILLFLAMRHFDLWHHFKPTIVKGFAPMFLPLLALNGVRQIFTITDRMFASFLPAGNLSGLSYARLLVIAIPSLLSLQTIFLTAFAEGDKTRQSEVLTRTIRFSLVVGIPLMAIFLIGGKPIVSLLFERGLFTKADTQITSSAVAFYAIGILGMFIYPVCTAAFQVLNRLGDLIGWVILGILVNAGANAFFIFYLNWGVKGIALATSMSYYIMVFAALWRLNKLEIRADWNGIKRLGFLICGLVGVLSPLLFFTAHSIWQFILGAISFGALYTAILLFLPVNELKDIQDYGLQLMHIIRRR